MIMSKTINMKADITIKNIFGTQKKDRNLMTDFYTYEEGIREYSIFVSKKIKNITNKQLFIHMPVYCKHMFEV